MTDSSPRPALVTAPPDPAEMARRLARVRERMAAEGLDAYVSYCPDNIFYLTNFANYIHERPFILVITMDSPSSCSETNISSSPSTSSKEPPTSMVR